VNLVAFLSDRCNMKCSYCFLSLNEGKATALSLDDLKRAIDAHRSKHPSGRVTLLGGEPSLHWDVLRGGVKHAGAPVTVVTNGTRLDGGKLAELQKLGAQVCVSLDGGAEDNDHDRKLLAGGSALAAALETLKDADKGELRVNMVVTPRNAGRFLRNLEFLRQSGFRKFSFHPDVLGDWTNEPLAALRASLAGLRAYLNKLGDRVEVAHAAAYAEACGGRLEEITLGADGFYYPNDGLFARPYAELERWRCGSAKDGLDEAALRRHSTEARRAIHGWIGEGHRTCPTEAYFGAAVAGKDPRAACERYARADAALMEALCAPAA
jgi:MoaA/NifB/PqqE/SkfB family radical SAM enzyme